MRERSESETKNYLAFELIDGRSNRCVLSDGTYDAILEDIVDGKECLFTLYRENIEYLLWNVPKGHLEKICGDTTVEDAYQFKLVVSNKGKDMEFVKVIPPLEMPIEELEKLVAYYKKRFDGV